MERTKVNSRDLKSVGYDPDTRILEIEFNNGGVYQYANVPSSVYTGLITASSHGSFLHKNVRNKYSYVKLA